MEPSAVAILADDLIWSTRLADLVRRADRRATVVRTVPALAAALPEASDVIIDLTSRTYDGVSAVEIAARGGHRVLCVAQHDDITLRKRAIGAGADRVYAYRLLAERGAQTMRTWLAHGISVTAAGTAADAEPAPGFAPEPARPAEGDA